VTLVSLAIRSWEAGKLGSWEAGKLGSWEARPAEAGGWARS